MNSLLLIITKTFNIRIEKISFFFVFWYLFRFNKPSSELERDREEERRFEGLNSLQIPNPLNFPPLGLKLFGIDSTDPAEGFQVPDSDSRIFETPGFTSHDELSSAGFSSGFENSNPPFLFEPTEEGYSGIYGFSTPRPYLAHSHTPIISSPVRYTPVSNPSLPPVPTHPSHVKSYSNPNKNPQSIFSKSHPSTHSITPKPYVSSLPQSSYPKSDSHLHASPHPSYSFASHPSSFPHTKTSYNSALLSPTYVTHKEDKYVIQHWITLLRILKIDAIQNTSSRNLGREIWILKILNFEGEIWKSWK